MNPGARGFTLIEIMIVVVIIGVLALIALPRFGSTREKAYRSQMQTDLRSIVVAQEAYFDLNLAYAPDVSLLDFNKTPAVTISILETAGNGWSAKATHTAIPDECGFYTGPVSPPAGIPIPDQGIIACTD